MTTAAKLTLGATALAIMAILALMPSTTVHHAPTARAAHHVTSAPIQTTVPTTQPATTVTTVPIAPVATTVPTTQPAPTATTVPTDPPYCYYLASNDLWSLSTSTTNNPNVYTVEVAPSPSDAVNGDAILTIGTVTAYGEDASVDAAETLETSDCQAIAGNVPAGA